METWLAIASKRDTRDYADTPIPRDVEHRILDAGRVSGSSQNKQRWEFVVVESKRQELSECVYAPRNVATAQLSWRSSAARPASTSAAPPRT